MNCTNCGHELTPTTAFRFVDGHLGFQPGLECHRCFAIYDLNGNLLQEPERHVDKDKPAKDSSEDETQP